MHILEKWLLFVFCQKRRPKDQQIIETNLASDQLMEKQKQQQQHQLQELPYKLEECPSRSVLLLEGRGRGLGASWLSRPTSHSPAQMEPISICADIHLQPDVVPEMRLVSYSSIITTNSSSSSSSISKRHSGVAIEDDIEVLAPMATSEM